MRRHDVVVLAIGTIFTYKGLVVIHVDRWNPVTVNRRDKLVVLGEMSADVSIQRAGEGY